MDFSTTRSKLLSATSKVYRMAGECWNIDERVFWIGGKAGSGKSTLMKFIHDHPCTKAALRVWAGPATLITASYFFWSSGSHLQKSQEGLLQTLLYDILTKRPSLISKVISTASPGDHGWTRSELLAAFASFKEHFDSSTKFWFFIDGLDEYWGYPRDLLEVLQNLSKCGNVKLCVSSRPWPIFKQAFDQFPSRRLYLHELTRTDISLYVRNKLE
jgi:hypothetical protein